MTLTWPDNEATKALRLLIVEDQLADAELMARALREAGVACEWRRVETESDYLAQLHEDWDVVLTDYTLPEYSALRVLQRLQERALDIPCIVVTGGVREETVVECIKRGAADYVFKDRLWRLGPAVRHALHEKELQVEKRWAEEALRESEAQYRDLCENASDLIQKVAPDGRLLYVNRTWLHTLGYREEEIDSRFTVFHILHPEYRASYLDVFRRVIAGEPVNERIETVFVRKDGKGLPVEGSINCQFVDGKPVATRGIFRDISARKALEQQRADFLAMVTHDIKNPLLVILGYTQLLLEEAREQGAQEAVGVLQRIEGNALTIHSLVNNYLQLSRIEAGQLGLERKPVLLNEVVRRVIQQYEGEAGYRHITLRYHMQEGLPAIEGDALELERVLTNLLNNALKFTPEFGHVTVSSGQRNGEVSVAVADTGPGIAPDEIPTIFDKYQRAGTSRRREGVGLGLFIVKTLVEAHGGRIEVKSNLGAGTCFSVLLPTAAATQTKREANRHGSASARSHLAVVASS